jgi:hypothetical protein
VVSRTGVRLDVRLPGQATSATLLTPDGAATGLTLSAFEGVYTVELAELPLYAIVVFRPDGQGVSS